MVDQPDGQQQRDVSPMLYTSSTSLAASGTDIKLVFEDILPSTGNDENAQEERRRVAVVGMSFHTAKDLMVLLTNALENVERLLGPIDTPFLQRQRENRPE